MAKERITELDKKYVFTFMIWVFLVALTELPLLYICPNIQCERKEVILDV